MNALKKELPPSSEPPKQIKDDLEILGIFKAFLQKKEKLWLWQKSSQAGLQRVVHYAIVKKIDPFKKIIELRPNNSSGFKLSNSKEPVFICSSQRGVAVKVLMREYNSQFISFSIPTSINNLSRDFLTNLELVERENEAIHQHERQSVRVQTKGNQHLGLKRRDGENLSPLLNYELYDMSQGGLAFEVYDPAEFSLKDRILVLSIDGKEMTTPIEGEVVSVRQLENQDIFKVGLKFITK
jgi:hypothetical protein